MGNNLMKYFLSGSNEQNPDEQLKYSQSDNQLNKCQTMSRKLLHIKSAPNLGGGYPKKQYNNFIYHLIFLLSLDLDVCSANRKISVTKRKKKDWFFVFLVK